MKFESNFGYKKDDQRSIEQLSQINFDHNVEKLNEFLEPINFSVLEDIFREKVDKSGGEKSELNILGTENIVNEAESGSHGGRYYAVDNIIGINMSDILSFANANDVDPRKVFLLFLVHEEAHAMGSNRIQIKENNQGEVDSHFVSGIDRTYKKYDKNNNEIERSSYGELFNEGVTDLIALEVACEYSKRTGEGTQKMQDKLMHVSNFSYTIEKEFVSAFVKKISEKCEIPEDIVWQSVKQAYFSGLNFKDDVISLQIEEIIGENFMDSFYESEPEDFDGLYFYDYLLDYSENQWTDECSRSAQRFINSLTQNEEVASHKK